MSEERDFAIKLADKVLDTPGRDPDDDLAVLARQFLRAIEWLTEARAANEHDRAAVADALGKIKSAIGSRAWMRESRGSYAWDDTHYQQEFGAALDQISEAADALRPIAANWSNCPNRWEEIQAARAGLPLPPAAP